MARARSIRGTVLQTRVRGELEVLVDQLIRVDADGTIARIGPADPDGDGVPIERGIDVVVPAGSVIVPGLIDTHVHAPQWPQLGTALDLPLDRWLFEYTFPLEARCAGVDYAERVWDDLVPGLLAEGTTTAVYFSSIHEEATLSLARACLRHGQRAFVGRVAMDHPDQTPAWYRDETAAGAVAASRRSIESIRAIPGAGDLVQPVITPRFVPACTDELLAGLGRLAADTGERVQSHVSENDWEHDHVLGRLGCTDTEALDRFGLLRSHTVLAHGGLLTAEDIPRIRRAGAGVAHCPLSNAYFGNAVFPARRQLDAGLRVGLGTDIAGGSDPSLLRQCAHAVTSSRMLEDGVDPARAPHERGLPDSRLDILSAFWLATVGGAELLGIPCGLLEPGRAFDAVMLRVNEPRPAGPQQAADPDWPRVFERLVRRADRTTVERVWVDGNEVTPGG